MSNDSDVERAASSCDGAYDQLQILTNAFVRSAPTFIGISDAEFRPISVNAAGRRLVGLGEGETISQLAITDFFVPEDRQIIENVGLPTVAREGAWQAELRFRHFCDPSLEIEVRWSAFALYDEGGGFIGSATITTDISDRKRAEQALEASRHLLSSILESVPLGIGLYDQQGRLVHGNEPLKRAPGLHLLPSFDPEPNWKGLEANGAALPRDDFPGRRALRGERVVPGVDLLRGTPGRMQRWTRVSAIPLSIDESGDRGALVVVQDIDDLKRTSEALAQNEARLRAASELVGLAVYSWDPQTDALEWDDRLRALWGLPPGTPVDNDVFEAGIHPEDLPRVREAIAACADPAGDGCYGLEYRVRGGDGVERWIATAGQTTFEQRRPVGFIGAVVDISERKRSEAAVRESEARFRSFAEHSTNLLWIIDPGADVMEYRSPAYEQIWGEPRENAASRLDDWFACVHPDDADRVRRALRSVQGGDVAQVEYRITRPRDGALRWLRDTSFPIRNSEGEVVRIGGIAEDLTRHDGKQAYLLGAAAAEERRLGQLLRELGLKVRTFSQADAFLDIAPFLAPGYVLVDLRQPKRGAASIALELRARSIPLQAIFIGPEDGDVAAAVEAMKSGAADYLQAAVTEALLRAALESIAANARAPPGEAANDEAAARLTRLSAREREVLNGLIEGGTNKTIAIQLGISPRTVELHRSQIMGKLNATNLAELLQLALIAGLRPSVRLEKSGVSDH